MIWCHDPIPRRAVRSPADGEAKRAAVDAFTDGLLPGRSAEVPAPTAKELAATIVLALPITDGGWILKSRTHGFAEAAGPRPAEDTTWAGVIPVRRALGEPVSAPGNANGVEVPGSVRGILDRA